MAMYEVGTITGAANQTKVTGSSNAKWSQDALGIDQGSILVVYKSGNADLYAIQSVDSDTQLTLTRNITTAFSGASYGIITAETASTSSFANQLASAFSLWRNVVAGWSAALTGSGNITLTDPITGASVTVPAIKGMMKTDGGNTITGTQNITSDNSAVIVGNNADIGIVKKSGTYGKVLMGANTRFCIAKSANVRIAATDDQTELFAVETNGDVKVGNSLYVSGLINSTYQLRAPSMEMSGPTPYLDFHYNSSSDDYSGRIIQVAADQLSVQGSHLRVDRDLRIGGMIDVSSGQSVLVRREFSSNLSVGTLISGAPFQSMLFGRGAYGDSRGAVANTYIEEYVGYNHRYVILLNGFGREDAWIFTSGGAVDTTLGRLATNGSDIRLKYNFTPPDEGEESRIKALGVAQFVMKGEERLKRGFLAQQVDKVDPLYVFQSGEQSVNGEQINIMNVDHNAIMADLVTVVQNLMSDRDTMRTEIEELKAQIKTSSP